MVLVECDQERARNLPAHAEFWAAVFYSLSSWAFSKNASIGHHQKLPSFADPFWTGNTPTGLVWASNISITSKGFNNTPHVDDDFSVFAFGVFCYCLSDTGEIYMKSQNRGMGDVKGACFWLDSYHIQIDFDHCDGVVEMLWCSDTHHHSSPSTTRNGQGIPIDPMKSPITRFGSSCQISNTFVSQVRFMVTAKDSMTAEQWDIYVKDCFKDYQHETLLRTSWTKKKARKWLHELLFGLKCCMAQFLGLVPTSVWLATPLVVVTCNYMILNGVVSHFLDPIPICVWVLWWLNYVNSEPHMWLLLT